MGSAHRFTNGEIAHSPRARSLARNGHPSMWWPRWFVPNQGFWEPVVSLWATDSPFLIWCHTGVNPYLVDILAFESTNHKLNTTAKAAQRSIGVNKTSFSQAFFELCRSARVGLLRMQQVTSGLLRTQCYLRFSLLKPGVDQNIALRSSPAARNSVSLNFAFPLHSISFSPNLLQRSVPCVINNALDFYLWYDELLFALKWWPPWLIRR